MPFPLRLFNDLKRRHSAPCLYYEGALNEFVRHDLIMCAPYLRSLSITFFRSSGDAHINDLGDLILSLPNLERLILKYYPSFGHGDPIPIFDLPPGSSLPPLRITSLANISFTPQQAAEWAQCLAQRNFRHLGLDGAAGTLFPLLDLFSGCVPSLKSLAIRIVDGTSPNIASQLNDLLEEFLH